jgi:uncharacterized membrane protein
MHPKRSKYDTNPLDPDVASRTEEGWGQGEGAPSTEEFQGATSRIRATSSDSPRSNIYSEAPTRRIDAQPSLDSSYPSVFVPPTPTYSPPPALYQPPASQYQPAVAQKPTSRNVEGLGLPEKWAIVLPYTPLYIGVVASIIELILVPRKEVRVRGHAAQGLALHMAIIAVVMLFGGLALITGSSVGGSLFKLAAFIFLITSMIRVGKGKTHRIAPLAEPAEWLNKHIDPRK